MRALLGFCLLACLAACSGDPKSFGITGPGLQPVPQPEVDTGNNVTPGVPQSGTFYGPTNGAVTGQSGYWGYNN